MRERPTRSRRANAGWARRLLFALVLSGACAGGQSGTETPALDDPFDIMAVEGPCGCGAADAGVATDCGVVDPETDVLPACAGDEDGGTP